MGRSRQLKPLDRQTMVITGATSGIGLSTARRAARAGACVFLIARGEGDLKALCEEIQGQGGRCAYGVADVADREALQAAADKCVRLFGGFDTWVNNAGIAIFGPLRETLIEDQRRLFETNYWGVVNGSLIAVEAMKAQDRAGVVVNVGSTLSDSPIPTLATYSASKHAVKGFTHALRMELLRERSPIRVTLVKPAAIDTPYSKHARNLTGHAVHNPQPVYRARVVADTILWCAAHSVREITVGGGGRLVALFYGTVPGLAEPLFARFAPSLMRDRASDYRPYEDGLYDPTEDGLEEEVHYPMVRNFSVLAEARKHPGITAGSLAVLALAAAATVVLTQRSGSHGRLRDRVDPRGWVDVDALRHRVAELTRALADRADDVGHRSASAARDARDEADHWFNRGRKALHLRKLDGYARKARHGAKDFGRAARRHAEEAGQYARDHAKEGGAILAVATLAAAIGAIALESRRADSKVRELTGL